MDVIHLLPDSVANQIAAGEVIQRPASCLKELVENSLDAGATHIQVLVRDAGRTMLQVIDDGTGMSETDARMAFERHATSKIRSASDLFSLRTMGFRGEALASICAVAQVELTTRREQDEVGTLLEIAGSDVIRQEPTQCPKGTNIKVKNLFFNVPARRRFLKTDQTELRNLLQDFYRIVLVYPSVHFTFVSDDEVLLDLTPGSYKQRIEQVFQRSSRKVFSGQLVDVKTNTQVVNIFGFVGKPEAAGKSLPQYFFVNGRYMKHPYFHKAVMTAYQGMLLADQAPAYFIYFDIAPEAIDVNIHPTKTEIKFADEQSIFQILLAAVRESLGKFNLIPSIDFNREGEIDMPSFGPSPSSSSSSSSFPSAFVQPRVPEVHVDTTYNPFKTRQTSYQPSVTPQWQTLYESEPEKSGSFVSFPAYDAPLIQLNGRLIVAPVKEGLLIVDQHYAHQQLLYLSFLKQMESSSACTQQLLFPDTIDMSAEQTVLLKQIMPDLVALGFEIDAVGKSSFIVNGVPSQLGDANGVRALMDILEEVGSSGARAKTVWRERIALSLARDAAIPYGKVLSETEMHNMLKQIATLGPLTQDAHRIYSLLSEDALMR